MKSQITLSAIQERMAQGVPLGRVDETVARRLWWAALETLQEDILLPMDLDKGFWLAAPLPALYEPKLLNRLQGWVWAPEELENLHNFYAGLLPPSRILSSEEKGSPNLGNFRRLSLLENDGNDPLLIIITPKFQVALALQGNNGKRNLLIRSDHQTLSEILTMLDLRLNNEDPDEAMKLRTTLADLGQLSSNDCLEKSFWQLLSERLARMAPSFTVQKVSDISEIEKVPNSTTSEITLLEALSHEVRTPLATIRTLIRSLIRREDLSELVIGRLKQIDSECTEQIDRFGLIFNAAELQRQQPVSSRLASTDLGRMLEILYTGWTEQLARRGIDLTLSITPDLPKVLSDPERLELMLGGLIDHNTRGLPPGGCLCMELTPAGQRLKLQILKKSSSAQNSDSPVSAPNADLGPVLSWNPSTGSLQLSKEATERLFASLGGRLRQRRDQGLTVFFPISEEKYGEF